MLLASVAMPALPRRFGRGDALTLVLLCAAAYVGNVAAVSLFSGVDLLLGGIAVMFTALRRSLAETMIVAGIGSLHTLVLWGHPYALVILVLEAIWVRFLYERWGREITLYDALFWLVVGVPLVAALYGVALGMDRLAVTLIALKQPVNGLLYTAVASLLHHFLLLRQAWHQKGYPRGRFADLLAPLLIVFALVPTLLVLSLYTQIEQRQRLKEITASLDAEAHELNSRVTAPTELDRAMESWRNRLGPFGSKGPVIALVNEAGEAVKEEPPGWLSRRPEKTAMRPGLAKRQNDAIAATMAREQDAYYAHRVTDLPALQSSGLELVVGVSAAPFVDRLRTLQLTALTLASVIGLGSVVGANAIARRAGRIVDPILTRLYRVPANLREDISEPWPEPPIVELKAVTDGLAGLEGDLSHQMRALADSEERYRAIATNLPGGVYQRTMTPDGEIRFPYLSSSYGQIFGLDMERALQEPEFMMEIIHPEDRPRYHAALERSARVMEALDVEFRVCHPDGRMHWVRSLGQPRRGADGTITWDGIAIDETARKAAEHRLAYLARYDTLTGVLNREEFIRQLGHFVGEPDGPPVAVLYVDLDDLKSVNDTLGHAAGDEVIREAARRIQVGVRDADQLSRYGGDEFVVLTAGAGDDDVATAVAQRILDQLKAPFTVGARMMDLSATIGIFMHAEHLDDAEECVRRADVALYYGKRTQRGTWWFYADAMDAEQQRWINLRAELREVLADDALSVVYQPQVDLASGRLVGVEALARWWHLTEGWVPPDWFIALAEESGLIDRLGDRVLHRACADLSIWQAQDPLRAPQYVAVNVSGHQLAGAALWDSVWDALQAHGLPAGALELEITERVFYEAGSELLDRLAAAGVSLSIDDYGKGYSSLFVLRDSPARVVKIDRSFVTRAETSESDRLIVEQTIGMAHSLGRTVVAEGVETAEQLAMLRRMGCDATQGYYLARPMEATQISAMWHQQW